MLQLIAMNVFKMLTTVNIGPCYGADQGLTGWYIETANYRTPKMGAGFAPDKRANDNIIAELEAAMSAEMELTPIQVSFNFPKNEDLLRELRESGAWEKFTLIQTRLCGRPEFAGTGPEFIYDDPTGFAVWHVAMWIADNGLSLVAVKGDGTIEVGHEHNGVCLAEAMGRALLAKARQDELSAKRYEAQMASLAKANPAKQWKIIAEMMKGGK
ncbi:MAG: hypothetical protein WCT40_04555 [Candidatus Magasanikbacteria bacterium]